MQFLEKYNLTPLKVFKALLVVLVALVVLSFVLASLNSARDNVSFIDNGYQIGGGTSVPSMPSRQTGKMMAESDYAEEMSVSTAPYMSPVSYDGYTSGDSEAFEVTDYSATIETQNVMNDCDQIRTLKTRTDIIFENASEHDRGCSYTFKTEKKSVAEVLALIEAMGPKELIENTYTIKREVDSYTSEIDILKRKLESLDATLTDAIAAYNDITATAKTVGDAETLARIIESKIGIIERLTNARIQTVSELDRYEKAKSDALDRMTYTHFTISIFENRYWNGEDLKDSWKREAQLFFAKTNTLVQDLSIGLVYLLLATLKYALYFFILLLIARLGWDATKRIWIKNTPPEK